MNDTKRKKYIKEEYIERVLEYAPGPEWRLLIALWRYGGLRRTSEPMRIRWCDVDWDRSLILVRATKTSSERHVPIFPEIMPHLLACAEQTEPGTEWVFNKICPAPVKNRPDRDGGFRGSGLGTQFDRICEKSSQPIIPMSGHNLRASCEKDLYSGKYPKLRGRIDLIGEILGHSPQVALTY